MWFTFSGITGQGQGSNQGNPLGLGLNLGALPMNPALVAAALNQAAGWGLINNLQNQPEPNFSQGGGGGGGFTNGPNNNARKYSLLLWLYPLWVFCQRYNLWTYIGEWKIFYFAIVYI